MSIKSFEIELQPNIPAELSGLTLLANDLYYSWNAEARVLFRRLDKELWSQCIHNPKLFLRRVDQKKLDFAITDSSYMELYARVLSSYNAYKSIEIHSLFEQDLDSSNDLIAYFCLEFGFHESLPIYSGGLGILAADLCKAASDMAVPFVGIGLLYRQGYFMQEINNSGDQIVLYHPTDFNNLPITPCKAENGEELRIHIELEKRTIAIRLWEATAGNIKLYLLDCDIEENDVSDRGITHQLYGGNNETRILQEIVLGIGGVRALRALNLNPTIWHLNEGHAAFSTMERCRESIENGLQLDAALELNASNVVFTTHTPVSAGHDIFSYDLLKSTLTPFIKSLNTDFESFAALGDGISPENFNMTTLALRTSRFHNGVSRIHGDVASRMESHIWPQIEPDENPISYVTNGVHISTFLAKEWANLLDMRHGEWRRSLNSPEFWECLDKLPSDRFWSLRKELKLTLLSEVQERIHRQLKRNGHTDAAINRVTHLINTHGSELLIFGFARRFATYKRANLLFYDINRLARLLDQTDKPILFIFAGKAHPKDEPGQHLIHYIHEISTRPEFVGKIILIENYDMVLARRLVAGVDVWINTPEYPMEASGTSGQKAGMNGVLNLSVLDGWWAEGFNQVNGWGISPYGQQFDHEYRNQQESSELLDIIEHEVIPAYFSFNKSGYSEEWVTKAKESMKSIIPNYNSQRMLSDYIQKFYIPAKEKFSSISDASRAQTLSEWKAKIKHAWPGVKLRCISDNLEHMMQGSALKITVAVLLNGLNSKDIIVELILGTEAADGSFQPCEAFNLNAIDNQIEGEQHYSLDVCPRATGLLQARIRAYPCHEYLCHRFEMGFMIWLDE
jgi:starch phosphorylase